MAMADGIRMTDSLHFLRARTQVSYRGKVRAPYDRLHDARTVQALIVEGLCTTLGIPRVHEKYAWFQRYFNKVCVDSDELRSLRIDMPDPQRRAALYKEYVEDWYGARCDDLTRRIIDNAVVGDAPGANEMLEALSVLSTLDRPLIRKLKDMYFDERYGDRLLWLASSIVTGGTAESLEFIRQCAKEEHGERRYVGIMTGIALLPVSNAAAELICESLQTVQDNDERHAMVERFATSERYVSASDVGVAKWVARSLICLLRSGERKRGRQSGCLKLPEYGLSASS